MIAVLGAGAFGTALAIAQARKSPDVILWGRNPFAMSVMQSERENSNRLRGASFPDGLSATSSLEQALTAETLLLALPMQQLGPFLEKHADALKSRTLVACCKGISLTTLQGPTALMQAACPDATTAVLTGPSFAADIARGLPTALTLACDAPEAADLQARLSTETLRLYRTSDTRGAELGGALKNVVAIACGVAIGAGLGESARAAVMTRGYAEMQRLAQHLGAHPETLSGLSGFGDLALTCTSIQSRNFKRGQALGKGEAFNAETTVEGAATAQAVARLARELNLDLPLSQTVAELVGGQINVPDAVHALLSRPLKQE